MTKIRSADWFRDKMHLHPLYLNCSESVRESAINLRKQARKEYLENRANRESMVNYSPLYIISNQVGKRKTWMLYPHSSTRQQARYARQNKGV